MSLFRRATAFTFRRKWLPFTFAFVEHFCSIRKLGKVAKILERYLALLDTRKDVLPDRLRRLEKRISGTPILPEDCPDQVFSRFIFPLWVGLRHEPPIGCAEIGARHALDLNRQLYRNGDALTDRGCGSSSPPGCPLHT